jgi:hypothetical protein
MQINFKGQYNRELFYRAVALANRPPKNRLRLLSILMVIAIGGAGVILYRIFTSGDWAGNIVYLVAAIFMGGYSASIYLRPYYTARQLWANPGSQRPLKGTITKQGIEYVFPEGQVSMAWKDLYRPQITKELVTLIRRKDGLLVIFPRAFIKRQRDWDRFQKLVESSVAPQGEKGVQRPLRSK